MAITFWSGLWTEGGTLVRQHDSDTKLTLGAANAVAGDLFPANNAFLRFVAANIPPDATVYLYCGPGGPRLRRRVSTRLDRLPVEPA